MSNDIINRLRADFGQQTLGQLLQDREAAANEIERLRLQVKQIDENKKVTLQPNSPDLDKPNTLFESGTLVSAADICRLLRISRSAFYLRRSENNFPRAIQLGPRTVRYEIDAIIAWRKGLSTKRL